jgi:hypothetical protein
MAHVATIEPHKTKGVHDETPNPMATELGPRMVPALDCSRGRVAVGLRRFAATPRYSPNEGSPAYSGCPRGYMPATLFGSKRYKDPLVIAPGR